MALLLCVPPRRALALSLLLAAPACTLANYDFNGRADGASGPDSGAADAAQEASSETSVLDAPEDSRDAAPPLDASAEGGPDASVDAPTADSSDGGRPCPFPGASRTPLQLLAPLSTSRTFGPTARLAWAAGVAGATDYVEVATDSLFTNVVHSAAGPSGRFFDSVLRNLALYQGRTLFWRVSRCASLSMTSEGSRVWSLQVGPSAGGGATVRPGYLDLNNDGFTDLVLGDVTHRRLHVSLGSAAGTFSSVAPVDAPAGMDAFGEQVVGVGDVNGDGFGDVLVGTSLRNGAPSSGVPGANVYLYFGLASGLRNTPVTLPMPMAPVGSGAGRFGAAGAAVGDLDGDGYGDFAVGAPGDTASPTGGPAAGAAWLFFGSSSGPSPDQPRVLPRPASLPSASGSTATRFGIALGGPGDLNGDGFADVAVGAEGRMVLFFGQAGASTSSVLLNTTTPALPAGADGSYGFALAGGGDVGGDGLPDLLVSAHSVGAQLNGAVWQLSGVVSGAATPAPSLLFTTANANQHLGTRLSSAGDLDGDGRDDALALGTTGMGNVVFAYLSSRPGSPFVLGPDPSLRAFQPLAPPMGSTSSSFAVSSVRGGVASLAVYRCTSASGCTTVLSQDLTASVGTASDDLALGQQ